MQVSIYPLRQEHLSPAIEAVRKALEARGLQPEVGPMSTVVAGEMEVVFAALQEAFAQAATTGHGSDHMAFCLPGRTRRSRHNACRDPKGDPFHAGHMVS